MDNIISKGFVLVIGAILLVIFGPQIGQLLVDKLDTNSAYPYRVVTEYAKKYAETNFAALNSSAAAAPVPITIAMLQTSGLPASFVDNNSFGQQHRAAFCRPGGGDPVLLVYTVGGDTINERSLRKVAIEMREAGGYVSSTTPTVITTNTSFSFPLASCPGLVPAITAGHLAHVIPLTNTGAASPYLCRFDTGDPECNTMRTNLNMAGNNITNVGDVCSSITGRCLSEGILETRQLVSGSLMPKPTCPASHVPGVYFGGGQFSDNGAGKPILRYEPIIDLTGTTPTAWQIRIYVYTENAAGTGEQRIEVSPNFGSISVQSTCLRS